MEKIKKFSQVLIRLKNESEIFVKANPIISSITATAILVILMKSLTTSKKKLNSNATPKKITSSPNNQKIIRIIENSSLQKYTSAMPIFEKQIDSLINSFIYAKVDGFVLLMYVILIDMTKSLQ